jgi:hypothetical protein
MMVLPGKVLPTNVNNPVHGQSDIPGAGRRPGESRSRGSERRMVAPDDQPSGSKEARGI